MKELIGIACAALLVGCGAPAKEEPVKSSSTCCASGCGCDPAAQPKEGTQRRIKVELLYLDLKSCERCQGADQSLAEAAAEVESVLKSAGVEIDVVRTHVRTEEQAKQRAFVTSPTVRVMGRDVQLDYTESACKECGDLAGCGVDCRVWTWRGKEYTEPPKEMLVDAILRAVYTMPHDGVQEPAPLSELPDNLKKFFRK